MIFPPHVWSLLFQRNLSDFFLPDCGSHELPCSQSQMLWQSDPNLPRSQIDSHWTPMKSKGVENARGNEISKKSNALAKYYSNIWHNIYKKKWRSMLNLGHFPKVKSLKIQTVFQFCSKYLFWKRLLCRWLYLLHVYRLSFNLTPEMMEIERDWRLKMHFKFHILIWLSAHNFLCCKNVIFSFI